jgi:hypothetical protein
MSQIIHSPAGALAPPADVTEQAAKLKAQGFTIDAIRYGQCTEPQAAGKSGWCIAFRNHQRQWFCWIFDADPLAAVEAIAVDVEIC